MRRVLIEAALHYRHHPYRRELWQAAPGAATWVIAFADKAMHRLNRRFSACC